MFEERLAQFSRERLGGRPVPDDLRVMLVAQWEGRDDFADLLGITFLEPGQPHPLLDTSYLREAELADPETQAINAGCARVAEHYKIVAGFGKGWVGYWLHPDEPADQPWPVLELDTEFTYWGMAGSTLAEACAADRAGYGDEPDEAVAFAELAARLGELGLPLSGREFDDLHDLDHAVDPEEFTDRLIDEERARRGVG